LSKKKKIVKISWWGQGGEMTQALYAHMNNKTIKKNKLSVKKWLSLGEILWDLIF
jgi:hypothetical protein